MKDKIKIMIIDDIKDTRENIGRLISLEDDLEVVAEANDAEKGIELAKKVQPDIILMDINLPGMDGLKATEVLSRELPESSVIIISVQEEHYYMQQAISAGAREFLMKPFSRDELVKAIRRVSSIEQKQLSETIPKVRKRTGEVITVFSGKGGVGKTTITVNLAVALARLTGEEVVVLDLDLQFGDVSLMMGLPTDVTITDLAREIDKISGDDLENYLLTHRSGVKVLAAPVRPEEAELIKRNHVSKIIHLLRQKYQYVLIDTEPTLHEINLVALDFSDKIILVSLLELAAIKNIRLSLQIMEKLNYSKEKILLILNRSNSKHGPGLKDFKITLNFPIKLKIPGDEKIAVRAMNTGEPFVLSNPGSSISKSIFELAYLVEPEAKGNNRGGLFRTMKQLFGK
ncbi:AAA family ATPase [Anoxybacter fermentans]|nr:response regulator [Anoxybacter fermentans]